MKTKRFIAGTVVFGDKDECAENVNVALLGEGEKKTVKTNTYGDFEFEGLQAEEEYSVRIEYPGYVLGESTLQIKNDLYLSETVST